MTYTSSPGSHSRDIDDNGEAAHPGWIERHLIYRLHFFPSICRHPLSEELTPRHAHLITYKKISTSISKTHIIITLYAPSQFLHASTPYPPFPKENKGKKKRCPRTENLWYPWNITGENETQSGDKRGQCCVMNSVTIIYFLRDMAYLRPVVQDFRAT